MPWCSTEWTRVWFAAAIFTNLTQDHLDYHATMEDYFEAKARLFAPGAAAVAVVNADDPWGERLLTRLRAQSGSGAGRRRWSPFPSMTSTAWSSSPEGSRFRWRGAEVRLRLGGRFNVRNALAAATAAAALGHRPGRHRRRDWSRWRPSGAASSRSGRASPSRCWWTTPTPPTGWSRR